MSAEDSRLSSSWRDSPASGVAAERRQGNAIAQAADSSCLSRPRFVLRQPIVTSTAPPWRGTPSRFSSTTRSSTGFLNNAHSITLEGAPMRRLYDSTKSHSTT